MWEYEHHFHTEDDNDGNMKQEFGVKVKLEQSSHSRHCEGFLIEGKLCYFGKIEEIMQVDFSSFHCVILKCNLWDTFDLNNVNSYHDSRLICINSKKMLYETREPYLFP